VRCTIAQTESTALCQAATLTHAIQLALYGLHPR